MFVEKRYSKNWIAAGLMIIAVGLIFEIMTGFSGAAQEQAASWPTVTGSVKSVEVRPAPGIFDQNLLAVNYLYQVDGVGFAGSQELMLNGPTDELLRTYQTGALVTVYYNPKAEIQSMLLPGGTTANLTDPLLEGPKNVLLASAVVASLPFLGIGVALRLSGKNTPARRGSKRTSRR